MTLRGLRSDFRGINLPGGSTGGAKSVENASAPLISADKSVEISRHKFGAQLLAYMT